MPTAAELKTGQVRGLMLALDPKQVPEPFVTDGENFYVDAEGPKAYFGGNIYAYTQLYFGEHAQTFRLGEIYFVATDDGIYEYDVTEKRFYPKLIVTALSEAYPWSMAYVGGAYYFARKDTGLYEYLLATDTWVEITTDVPTNPHAVCRSNGRLICVGEDTVAWSEISNGQNFTTDVDLGVGAQSLAIIGFGDVYGVYKVGDGFITFTANGTLKSKFIDGINPYFHDALSDTERALSAFCITTIGKDILAFLTVTGFYTITAKGIEAWQPLMSSYLTQKRFPFTAYQTSGVYSMQYVEETQMLFVSIAENDVPNAFTVAYCLYLPRDEWGVYNRQHRSFGLLPSAFFTTARLNMVVFTSDNWIYEFSEIPYTETAPEFAETVVFRGDPAPEPRSELGVNVFPTGANLYTGDFTSIVNVGLYNDLTGDAIERVFEGLSSYATVGVLRASEEVYPDRVNYFTDLAIGSLDSGSEQEFEDWNAIADGVDDQDWNALSGAEDWGFGVVSIVNYNITMYGSLDGIVQYENQTEDLTEYVTEGTLRVYKPYITGIYGLVKLSADLSGESFHLKYLSATGNLGGRL